MIRNENRVGKETDQGVISEESLNVPESGAKTATVSVCAVVLTFNRLDRLAECLTGIQNQTRILDAVLVVDNDSSDGTREYLDSLAEEHQNINALLMQDNLGPAGGFAAGIQWAVENGYDYIWLCDDDSVPDESCLENQLDEMDGSRGAFVLSRNVDEKGGSSFHAAWRGVLVSSDAVRKAGVPNEGYFFSKEDTDWYWRLEAAGIQRRIAEDAIVRFWQYYQSKKATWKYYYWGRNTIYYRLRVQKCKWYSKRFRKLILTMGRLWFRIIVLENQKPKKARFLALGIVHGLKGRLGKTVDPSNS